MNLENPSNKQVYDTIMDLILNSKEVDRPYDLYKTLDAEYRDECRQYIKATFTPQEYQQFLSVII